MSPIGFLFAPFVALIRHLRRLDLSRGSIETSDARTLWEQAAALREEMAARIATLEEEVRRLDVDMVSLRALLTESLIREGRLVTEVAILTNGSKRSSP